MPSKKQKKKEKTKLQELLKEVIILITGKQSEEIADLLYSKKHVNEFLISKKLDITINQTRNILYKISDHGLVSSIRKKDKRKGWYTYFWKIEVTKTLEFLKEHLNKKINQLENHIKSRETKLFYTCENCKIEFNEENALLYNFTCNECGKIFVPKDNTKLLRESKRNLDKLKRDLALVEDELGKERTKEEKSKLKELKREKEEKALKRSKKRKMTKKKLPKKSAKKKPKKKVSKKKPVKKKFTSKKKPVKRKSPSKKKKPAKTKGIKKKLKKKIKKKRK